jgi:poly(3-hydroxybutyrate) depolymerase
VNTACWTLALLLASGPASADKPKPPCTGCTLDVPAKAPKQTVEPMPLLVVLHGDREHAAPAVARWRAAASKRGWAVLGLECPKELGCKDSFWQWNGDPVWVTEQVAKVGKSIAIDPARVALVGWSGGGSYIGLRAQTWPATFSGVVVHGGGMAPMTEGCAKLALPSYFLVGDRNPLHRLAQDLRAHFDGCKQVVVWDLVRGGDHDREERALDAKKALAILDWLYARPRVRPSQRVSP